MTPEQKALRDAFLAECWKPCREIPREDRAAEKAVREAGPQVVDNAREKRSEAAS